MSSSIGNDLATIRKQQNLTLEDIHDITKIPVHILQSIEDESIFEDFEENKTYTRSYIRGYGKALKIEDGVIVQALDDYEVGIYSGRLLGEEEDEDEELTPPPIATEEETKPEDPITSAGDDTDEEPAPTDEFSGKGLSGETGNKPPQTPPSVNTVDWTNMGKKVTPHRPKSRVWLGITIILLIVITIILFWYYQNNPDFFGSGDTTSTVESSQNLSQPAVVPDSLQLNLENPEDTSSAVVSESREALSDTLKMLVYAAHEKLEPVRVYTDVMDDLNPYWIEQGEAYEFTFVNLIRIRGQYSRMELMLNGHPIENFRDRFYNPDTRMLEIERTVFEGDDRWLQPPPDSTALDFPPPTVTERPIFNN